MVLGIVLIRLLKHLVAMWIAQKFTILELVDFLELFIGWSVAVVPSF